MASWLARSFLSVAQKRLLRTGVPVFMLHKIGRPPQGTRDPFDDLTGEALESRLSALDHAGFSPATLDDFVAQRVLMGNSFIVTFDDGYRNVVEQALPVLA